MDVKIKLDFSYIQHVYLSIIPSTFITAKPDTRPAGFRPPNFTCGNFYKIGLIVKRKIHNLRPKPFALLHKLTKDFTDVNLTVTFDYGGNLLVINKLLINNCFIAFVYIDCNN